jgi:hypothetical protein
MLSAYMLRSNASFSLQHHTSIESQDTFYSYNKILKHYEANHKLVCAAAQDCCTVLVSRQLLLHSQESIVDFGKSSRLPRVFWKKTHKAE